MYHWKEILKTTEENPREVNIYPDGVSVDRGEQELWFVNVLSDAKSKGMAVIVALHSPCVNVEKIDCTFDTLGTRAAESVNEMKNDMI